MTVYALGALGTGLVKVGFTSVNPQKRMPDIQTGCPYNLVLIGKWVGGEDKEKSIHLYLRRIRCKGEWFDFGQMNWNAFFGDGVIKPCHLEILKGLEVMGLMEFCLEMPSYAANREALITLWRYIGLFEAVQMADIYKYGSLSIDKDAEKTPAD